MIKVAFRYGDTRWIARLTCWVRGGDVAHCEVVHDSHGGSHTCVSSSWVDGGPREKTMPLPADRWRIYEVVGDPLRARAWLAAHYGESYGWLKLLAFVPGVRLRAGGPICSGAAADVLGLDARDLYCPHLLEAMCKKFGRRVQ